MSQLRDRASLIALLLVLTGKPGVVPPPPPAFPADISPTDWSASSVTDYLAEGGIEGRRTATVAGTVAIPEGFTLHVYLGPNTGDTFSASLPQITAGARTYKTPGVQPAGRIIYPKLYWRRTVDGAYRLASTREPFAVLEMPSPGLVAPTYIGEGGNANGNTVSAFTRQAGDLLLGFAGRASVVGMTVPAGWNQIDTVKAEVSGESVAAWRIATNDANDLVSWPNAGGVRIIVLRGQAATSFIRQYAFLSTAAGTTTNFPALPSNVSGGSLVAGYSFVRNTAAGAAPGVRTDATELSNRTALNGHHYSTFRATANPAGNWGAQTVNTLGGLSSSGSHSWVVEVQGFTYGDATVGTPDEALIDPDDGSTGGGVPDNPELPTDPEPEPEAPTSVTVTAVPTLTFTPNVAVNSEFAFGNGTVAETDVTLLRRLMIYDTTPTPTELLVGQDVLIPNAYLGRNVQPAVEWVRNGVTTRVLGPVYGPIAAPPQFRTILGADVQVLNSVAVTNGYKGRFRFPGLPAMDAIEWSTSALATPTEGQWEVMALVPPTTDTYEMLMRNVANRTGVPPSLGGVDFSVFGSTASEGSRSKRIRFRGRQFSSQPLSLPSPNFEAAPPPVGDAINLQEWRMVPARAEAEMTWVANFPELFGVDDPTSPNGKRGRYSGGGKQGGHCCFMDHLGNLWYWGDMNGFRKCSKGSFSWHYPPAAGMIAISGNGIGIDPADANVGYAYASAGFYSSASGTKATAGYYAGGIYKTTDGFNTTEFFIPFTAAHTDSRKTTQQIAFFPPTGGTVNGRLWVALEHSSEKALGDCRMWKWNGDGTGIASRVMPSWITNRIAGQGSNRVLGHVIHHPTNRGEVIVIGNFGIYRCRDIEAWINSGTGGWTRLSASLVNGTIYAGWINPNNPAQALFLSNAGLQYTANFGNDQPTFTTARSAPNSRHFGVGPLRANGTRTIVLGQDRATKRVPIVTDWNPSTGAPNTGWADARVDQQGIGDPDNIHAREVMGNGQTWWLPDPTDPNIWHTPGYMLPWVSVDGGRTWRRNDDGFSGTNIFGAMTFVNDDHVECGITDVWSMQSKDRFLTRKIRKFRTRYNNFDQRYMFSATVTGTRSDPGRTTFTQPGLNFGGSIKGNAVVVIPDDPAVHASARLRVLMGIGGEQNGGMQNILATIERDADEMSLMAYTGDPDPLVGTFARRPASSGGGIHVYHWGDVALNNPNLAFIGPYRYDINASGVGTFSYVDGGTTNMIGMSKQTPGIYYGFRGTTLFRTTNIASPAAWTSWFAYGASLVEFNNFVGDFSWHETDLFIGLNSGRTAIRVVRGTGAGQAVTTFAQPDASGGAVPAALNKIRGIIWCKRFPRRAYFSTGRIGYDTVYRADFNADFTSVTFTNITYNFPLTGKLHSVPQTGELFANMAGQGPFVLPPPEGLEPGKGWTRMAAKPIPRI